MLDVCLCIQQPFLCAFVQGETRLDGILRLSVLRDTEAACTFSQPAWMQLCVHKETLSTEQSESTVAAGGIQLPTLCRMIKFNLRRTFSTAIAVIYCIQLWVLQPFCHWPEKLLEKSITSPSSHRRMDHLYSLDLFSAQISIYLSQHFVLKD